MFWSRAARIYTSYKFFQVKQKFIRVASASTDNKLIRRFRFNQRQQIENSTLKNTAYNSSTWENIHDINSDRMMKLCLAMRGFYLKTGQFLGTRHDFMPTQYTSKLSKLHDEVPPLNAKEIRAVIEKELCGRLEDFFFTINLDQPIGSASIAQVHKGIWKATGETVAVKIQYPNAEKVMSNDLHNIRILAELLQKTELKFDILSAVKELQRQIGNEFNFIREAKNMDYMRIQLMSKISEIDIPRSIFCTKRLLVMTFIPGDNLSKLAAFRKNRSIISTPKWLIESSGRKLLQILAKAWAEQIFVLQLFNADPHPGNICINPHQNRIGLLDWGQMKSISNQVIYDFSCMIESLNSHNQTQIVNCFLNQLHVEVQKPQDYKSVEKLAISMFDTQKLSGEFIMDPFHPNNSLKSNPVIKLPSDLYFIMRTIQLFRGISFALGVDFSLANQWSRYAKKILMKGNPMYT